MHWGILLASAVFEAVWATALGQSDGFTRPVPAVVFAVAAVASMIGLTIALRRIPVGVAYSVWTGLGAALTVGYAMLAGDEAASAAKILFIAGIVACVAGLRLVPTQQATCRKRKPDGARA